MEPHNQDDQSGNSSSTPLAIEVEQLIDEFLFLSMKYARVMDDITFYERLKDTFNVPSRAGENAKHQLYDDAKQELHTTGSRLEEIRRKVIMLVVDDNNSTSGSSRLDSSFY